MQSARPASLLLLSRADVQINEATPRTHAFLLIEQPRQRLGHWINVLAALDSPFAPTACAVSAHYDPANDQALLELSYEERVLDDTKLQYVVNVAILAEVGMVQPAKLSESERARFLSSRLARCTERVSSQSSAVGALIELVKKLKTEKSPAKPPPIPPKRRPAPTPPPIPPIPEAAALEPPTVTAKGTRDNMRRLTPEGVVVGTIDLGPRLKPGMIHARYLRGEHWTVARVGALSLKGAALLAGALPRLHDRVDIELTFGSHHARVRGTVSKISTVNEASTTGASTFTVSFRLDDATRTDLTQLLLAARAAKVTIKPPPPRAQRRFPVEWQVQLGTKRGAQKGIAHDVSIGGMFVRPLFALELDELVGFAVSLDEGAGHVAGRARVARQITDEDAAEHNLVAGFGLEITDMTIPDRERWNAFVMRVERRAQKRVIIGARHGRLTALQMGLASLGYAVVGGSDPSALLQLASAGDSRPADAVLLDSDWLSGEASTAMVAKLAAQKLPCVTMQGEPRRARQALDKLLDVAE